MVVPSGWGGTIPSSTGHPSGALPATAGVDRGRRPSRAQISALLTRVGVLHNARCALSRVRQGGTMPSFDLRDRPWIPVRYISGAVGPPMTGLAGLFLRAHEIADITVPVPPAASGLWRILYLIAARISGLGDLEALDGIRPWKQARNQALAAGRFDPDATGRYFTEHADRFDLFGSARPWLQDPRLAGGVPQEHRRQQAGHGPGNRQQPGLAEP